MIVVTAELAAVVAGADAQGAAVGSYFDDRGQSRPHRIGDIFAGQAVDDDFEHRPNLGRKSAVDRAFQSRAVAVIGRRARALVFRADLRPRTRYAAWKRHDNVGDLAHRLHCGLGRVKRLRRALTHYDEIAAADRFLGEIGGRLADEFAIHHRNAPVSAIGEPLGDLPAIAEETNRISKLELVFA